MSDDLAWLILYAGKVVRLMKRFCRQHPFFEQHVFQSDVAFLEFAFTQDDMAK
jgi:hypothetical protein